MQVHELIARLQNFDMYLSVKCLTEATDWAYDEEMGESVEIDIIVEAHVAEVKLVDMGAGGCYILIK